MYSKSFDFAQDKLLEHCLLCGHRCAVNRLKGEVGICRAGLKPKIASNCMHRGEEPMISGANGSGTIFFSYCSLCCVYCQNQAISQQAKGEEVTIDELAGIMLKLQGQKAHNINLVSPTHYAPQIMEALSIARGRGLKLPVVYNTGGYDSLELIKMLQGKVDIYMPDFKYFEDEKAGKYSGAGNYVEVAQAGITEMFRQVGNIKLNDDGVAVSGLLVRHLVLPNSLSDSEKVINFLASLSKDLWVSIMSQYNPKYNNGKHPELARKLNTDEYRMIVDHAQAAGLHNLYLQEIESSDNYLPDFSRNHPFE